MAGISRGASNPVQLICPAVKVSPNADKAEKRQATLHKRLAAIAKGGDINAADKNGQTALMYAAAVGNDMAACWLVAKGADVTLKSKSGKTAADYAQSSDIRDLLELCATPPTPKNEVNLAYDFSLYELPILAPSIAAAAAENKLENAVKWLSQGQYGIVNTMPHVAYLVRLGYDVNTCDESTRTLGIGPSLSADTMKLMLALGLKIENGNEFSQLMAAALMGDARKVEQLLNEHQELTTHKEIDSIMRAARSKEVVGSLISYGCEIPQQNIFQSPGHFHPEALEKLLKSCHDVRVYKSSNDDHCSPLGGFLGFLHSGEIAEVLLKTRYNKPEDLADGVQTAVLEKDLPALKVLVAAGADVKSPELIMRAFRHSTEDGIDRYQMRRLPATLTFLLEQGAEVNGSGRFRGCSRLVDSATALQGAIMAATEWHSRYEGIAEGVQVLLKAGAQAPGNILLELGSLDSENALPLNLRAEIAVLLVQAGADINAQAEDGNTFLMQMCKVSRIWNDDVQWDARTSELMSKIVDDKTQLNLRNKEGKTALDIARELNHAEAVKFLQSHGAGKE